MLAPHTLSICPAVHLNMRSEARIRLNLCPLRLLGSVAMKGTYLQEIGHHTRLSAFCALQHILVLEIIRNQGQRRLL